ncbi:TPA: hypothetical protein ACGPMP_002017 [Enterobacter roggenkampii]|uniref:hypothetical protein n=1 Tax=Enterobacter vonholyi TaxID=2797505 RepID=UPI0011F07DA6|nr:hypothetical protein [Enterobacter vonholyi]KAA0511621.1 hypothetical protein F0319_08705 [Enterobacter vonholyi]
MNTKKPSDDELKEFLLKMYLEEVQAEEEIARKAKEHKEIHETLRKLAPTEFYEYLSEQNPPIRCSICGNSKFSTPTTSTVDRSKLPANMSELTKDEQKLAREAARRLLVTYTFLTDMSGEVDYKKAYYPLHCRTCGHLDLFRASVINLWKEQKEKAEFSSESDPMDECEDE